MFLLKEKAFVRCFWFRYCFGKHVCYICCCVGIIGVVVAGAAVVCARIVVVHVAAVVV